VAEVAREVDLELRTDPRFEPFILEPVQFLGVTAFSEWSMQLRMQIKTVPEKQWLVGREFRKRLRVLLNRRGVEVPYPALRPPSPS
jgi:small conductance mechanosensitive channel